jgi:hypothetical protein
MLNPPNLEHSMFLVMAAISKMEVPIVFKGYQILHLILNENNYHDLKRSTKDIDLDWVGKTPTMEELE